MKSKEWYKRTYNWDWEYYYQSDKIDFHADIMFGILFIATILIAVVAAMNAGTC